MAFVIDRSLYLSPEVVGEPGPKGPLVGRQTVEHFIAWLETKPADEDYCYSNYGGCLIFQYGLDHGGTKRTAYEYGLDIVPAAIVTRSVASSKPHTFGAAKDRARKLLAEREK